MNINKDCNTVQYCSISVQIKSEIMINPDASAKNQENIMCKKKYVWNRGIYTYGNSIYLESIIGDSVIKCGEIT